MAIENEKMLKMTQNRSKGIFLYNFRPFWMF